MIQLPSNVVAIGSLILTVAESALSAYDKVQHTTYVGSPVNLAIIAILGLIGIHQVVASSTAALRKPKQ